MEKQKHPNGQINPQKAYPFVDRKYPAARTGARSDHSKALRRVRHS